MLLIHRKPGEKIHIGDSITITVTESSSQRVMLGIEAPRDVPVWRPGYQPEKPKAPADDAKV